LDDLSALDAQSPDLLECSEVGLFDQRAQGERLIQSLTKGGKVIKGGKV
jgi:hypothetical protein